MGVWRIGDWLSRYMSDKYKLYDIFSVFCGYFWPDLVDYGCGFMSHKMEIDVPGGCRGGEGVCPFFFRGWARDECGKKSYQLVDKVRGKSTASVGAAAARPGLLLRFGERE
jgi:hypothetical protein